jgi:hypothetical protein
MNNEFIPYELALELKQLGFDEPCFGRYIYDGRGKEWFLVQTQQTKSTSVIFEGARSVDGISVAAPLFQQAFRWFREQHGLCLVIKPIDDKKLELGYNLLKNGLIIRAYTTYEKSELACLRKLIEIVKASNK